MGIALELAVVVWITWRIDDSKSVHRRGRLEQGSLDHDVLLSELILSKECLPSAPVLPRGLLRWILLSLCDDELDSESGPDAETEGGAYA